MPSRNVTGFEPEALMLFQEAYDQICNHLKAQKVPIQTKARVPQLPKQSLL